jgi:hypothetical protein
MLKYTLVLIWFLLAPLSALAAEGLDAPDAGYSTAWSTVEAYYLCDGNHAASQNCAEFDMKNINGQKRGAPATIQFLIYRQSAACTPTVTVFGRATPTATGGGTQVDHNIQALVAAGTSSYSTGVPTLFRVYYATVSADADCTDLEVLMLLHYPAP